MYASVCAAKMRCPGRKQNETTRSQAEASKSKKQCVAAGGGTRYVAVVAEPPVEVWCR